MAKEYKIALAGEGGQGVQSVAGIIVEAANDNGREALYIPNFGVEQRGGVSIAFVQIADEKIGSPKFKKADIVIALSDRAVRRTAEYVDERTTFVYDTAIQGVEEDLPKNAAKVYAIPAISVAKNELHPRVFNIVIMGAVIEATKVIDVESAKGDREEISYKFEQDPN